MSQALLIIAGPCAVESPAQLDAIASSLQKLGITHLRANIFKPRTSPSSFQGIEHNGIKIISSVAKKYHLKLVTEILDPDHLLLIAPIADIIQIGSRNMHNSALLKKIAQAHLKNPILLKRGFAATKQEVLGAINYLKEYGHQGEIILCERGIRTFTDGEYSRATLDLNFLAALKSDPLFHHRIIIDPSHAAGTAKLIEPLALAGIAAGADGLLIEVSLEPYLSQAQSDKEQHITPDVLKNIIQKSKQIHQLINKK